MQRVVVVVGQFTDKFVPYVRGNRYTDIGSTGALTLISVAWQLAIFERAME